jgi:opacity protein-like surface antigen
MRKSIPLIVLAALLAAPAAFAQSQGQDQSKSAAQGYKPSAETPAQQKERNKDYSKMPGMPGNKSGPPAQQSR